MLLLNVVKFYTLDDSVMFHLKKVDPIAAAPSPDEFLIPDYGFFSAATNPFVGASVPTVPRRG